MLGKRDRLLAPDVLAGLSNLELVARTAVEGSLIGLHRSAKFGFSQEFAEYRAYSPGDDLRFIDWNVFARTDRTFVKRFYGDTNTRLVVALDIERPLTLTLAASLYTLGMGPAFATAPVRAMEEAQGPPGAAAALLGTIEMGGGAIGALGVGALHDGTSWPMGMVIAGAGLAALFFFQRAARGDRR